MSSLRRLRKGLKNLEEDLDRVERSRSEGGVRPFLLLDREGEHYVSAETGVPYCRVEELHPEDPPPRAMLVLTARARREEAESLAPLFGDPGDVEPVDPEAWSLRYRDWLSRQPWHNRHQDDDDQDGGRKVGGDDPPDDPTGPSTSPKDHRRRAPSKRDPLANVGRIY